MNVAFLEHRYRPINPNLPSLRKSGMTIGSEMDRFDRTLQKEESAGKNRAEATETGLWEIDTNIRTTTLEFMRQGLVLPHLIKIGEHAGRRRVVNSYNNVPILDVITKAERLGSVHGAVEELEEKIIDAEDGAIGMYTSPPKWTGLGDFEYKDTQSFIWWKEKGDVKGVTLRSDMSVEQNLVFLERFGVDTQALHTDSEHQTLANITRNVVFISPDQGRSLSIDDIAQKILEVRGRGDITVEGYDGRKTTHSAQNMLDDLKKRDELLQFNQTIEQKIGDFKDFVRRNSKYWGVEFTKRRIADELRRTILAIQGEEMVKKGFILPKGEYAQLEMFAAYFMTASGCNGGGTESVFMADAFGGGRFMFMPDMFSGFEKKCSKCPKRGSDVICGICKNCARGMHYKGPE